MRYVYSTDTPKAASSGQWVDEEILTCVKVASRATHFCGGAARNLAAVDDINYYTQTAPPAVVSQQVILAASASFPEIGNMV